MPDEGSRSEKIRIKIEQHTLTGGLWCATWLFTIGFLHLNFWSGCQPIWPRTSQGTSRVVRLGHLATNAPKLTRNASTLVRDMSCEW
jgi:hypothetical protein